MTVNEATWDRAIRVVAGLVFLYLGWGGVVAGGLGTPSSSSASCPY